MLDRVPISHAGCLVPLSTLTFELDGGLLWPEIADWKHVVDAVVRLTRDKACDAMPLGLPPWQRHRSPTGLTPK